MQSALSASVGQNSRQVFLEHHEEIFGKPHKSTKKCVVNDFDFAEKMPCARRSVTATPQRRAFAKLRVVLCESPMSVGRRTRMRSKAEFCCCNGECHSQFGRKASPQLREECSIGHRLDTVALLHICFPCSQSCQTFLTILPTHSALAQVCHKIELHLTW